MRCSRWQIGVDNQAEEGCAVAVQRHRQGWQLHHGRHLPFSLKALHGAILPQPWRRGETIYEQTADFLRNLCHYHLAVTGFSGGYFCADVRNLGQSMSKRLPGAPVAEGILAPCVAAGSREVQPCQERRC